MRSLAVAQLPDGRYEGWLVGQTVERTSNSAALSPPESMFMHLAPNGGWERYPADDALGDYAAALEQVRVAMVPTRSGSADAYVAAGGVLGGVLLKFTRSRGRWDVVPSESNLLGSFRAISSDGQGGLWVARIDTDIQRQFFFRLTDRPRRPVFSEVPNPAGSASFITAAAAGPEGSFWVATASDAVYRYDRLAGWDRVRVPGWDPSRVSTRPSQATAIALNQAGAGLVVGEQGRIAEIAGGAVRLDAAAGGALCDLQAPQPPCGTGRDLRAAALAPDGSAIVAGVGLALLWRPAGGEFRAIERPDAAAQTTITAVAMPAPERAWLTTDSGFVFAGRMGAPGEWSWQAESFNERGDPLTLDRLGGQLALGAIAVDADGHGFALGNNGVAHGYRVGATGVILERSGDGEHPWRRLAIPYHDSFTSVALPVGGGEGALFGAERGAIYTYDGQRLEPARLGEWPRSNFGFAYATDRSTYERPVVGLALLPGAEPGQSEAWAALQGSPDGDSSLLHWASDPTEPLLDPVSHGAAALADTPAPRPGELSFASFGYSRCSHVSCPEMTGTDLDSDLYARRIAAELAARGGQPAGPSFALFSGDSSDQLGGAPSSSDPAGRLKPARFSELVAEPLDAAGVPLFGAIGAGDLSGVGPCTDGLCGSLAVGAGENLGWRQGFARRPAPWGRGEAAAGGGYEFEPVSDAEIALRPDEQGVDAVHVADPDGSMGATSDIDVPTGGASTHYALDVVRDGEALARLVFIDSSLRSLQAADPIQNPLEPKGQLDWLAAMLCFAGEASPSGEPCSRERGEQAVVVTNAPTYSYGPGQLNQTALDAALVEQALLDGEATVVISGRIGWNALYYALGSGIHEPQPGGDYPERAPQPLAPGGRVLPFVVSAGAGRFAADAPERSASAGYWHGYTIVRLGPSGAGGDPAGDHSSKVIVEQRPLLDWIHLAGENHVVAPGARLGLQGFGREPIVATDFTEGNSTVVRDDEIDSAAITHRYDLVLADPEAPWLACEAADAECQSLAAKLAGGSRSFDSAAGFASGSAQDDMGGASVAASGAGAGENPCEPYLCLPQRIGAIDRITGVVKAGDGKYPDTFAIAMLSVDDEVATYPLVFEKSPSFVIQPLRLPAPEPGPPPGVPSAPNAPAPPPVPKPSIPNPTLPELPALPGVPPLAAAQPPEPQPPAPPTPPPPTEQPSPLDLTVSPTALTVATPAAVIQPPTPPVNPAPPSGARREARQRQAAAQKSGADSEEASEMQSMHGDLAEGPPSAKGVAMTRRDRTRPAPSFTTLARPDQPSAWAQGALYGGGIALMSLVLALGLNTARPTPRRRPPEVPAPALAPARRRW